MPDSATVRVRTELDTRPAERKLSRFIRKAESADIKLRIRDKEFTQPLGRITGAADEFNKSLAASNARVIAFAASAGLLYAVQRGFQEVAKSAIQVEKALTDINVILNASEKNLSKFGAQLFNIAGKTGQAFDTVSEAATELARQGLTMEETLKRTRDAMILTRLSGMDAASAVQSLTAALNTFNKSALTSTQIVNKMANVDAAFAVSTNDLAEALKRVGSSAQDAGVGFDQLLAIVTSVQQTTARGGAVIGNSLKSIFTRVQRTEVIKQLEHLGVAVRDTSGAMLPAMQVMTNLAKTIDSLTHAQKANITELMGGVFQINVVKAALGDLGKQYSIYQNALDAATGSTNQAILRNEELNKTLDALVNKTFQNVKKAAAAIGKLTLAPALENAMKAVNFSIEGLMGDGGKEAEGYGAKIGKGMLEGLGRFIAGPGMIIGLALVGKLLTNFSKFASESFKEFFNLNEATKQRIQLEKFVNSELSKSEDLMEAILKGELSVVDAEKILLQNLKNRTKEQEKFNRLVREAATGLKQSGVRATLVDPVAGTYAVKAPKATKSSGHIPSFSAGNIQSLVRKELSSASYASSGTKAVIDTLPGVGAHIRNTKETLAYAPGMRSPFINPPKGSTEGIRHRAQAKKRTGVDPYKLPQVRAADGFVPNFARGRKKTEVPDGVHSINTQKYGVLLPDFGQNSHNLVLKERVMDVFPESKKKKWHAAGIGHVEVRGMKEARMSTKVDGNFDQYLDSIFTPAIHQLAANITKDNDMGDRGQFSSYFDGKAWPQVRGRIFESTLAYIQQQVAGSTGGERPIDARTGLKGADIDFRNIQNQLATLYGVPVGGHWDAKNTPVQRSSYSGTATNTSMINKVFTDLFIQAPAGGVNKRAKNASKGFIPNFALSYNELLQRIEAFDEGIITNGNGIRTQIGAHPRLQEKNVLLSRFESAKKNEALGKKGLRPLTS